MRSIGTEYVQVKQLTINHLARNLARIVALGWLMATCLGCVVWHTEEIVLIEPNYSHVRDNADQDYAADRPTVLQASGKQDDH